MARRLGKSPVNSGLDNPKQSYSGRAAKGAEHDYSRDDGNASSSRMHGSPASRGMSKGAGPVAGAGEQQYGFHGGPGAAAKRYAGMSGGSYPSRDVGSRMTPENMDVYREGDPPSARAMRRPGGGMSKTGRSGSGNY